MGRERDEINRRIKLMRAAGAVDLIAMLEVGGRSDSIRETDPEQALASLEHCSAEARRLDEPWWELFNDRFQLLILVHYLVDLTRGLPFAIQLRNRFETSVGRTHESRHAVGNLLLNAYILADPLAYPTELERGIAELDAEIEPAEISERCNLHHAWAKFLIATERWGEADDLATRSLGIAEQAQPINLRNYDLAALRYLLCQTCFALGWSDRLARHAQALIEVPRPYSHSRRSQAVGWLWLAVALRIQGNETTADQAFRRGKGLINGVLHFDLIGADPEAIYQESRGDLRATLSVRDHELAAATAKGMVHRATLVQIERCRLLDALGKVPSAELSQARRQVGRLLDPGWYAAKLDKLPAPIDWDD